MTRTAILFERARSTPENLALADSRMRLGWAALADRIQRTATALSAGADARDRPIAVCAQNAAEIVIVYAAATLARIPIVPLSFHLKAEEIAYIVQDADCRLVFADADTLDAVIEARALGAGFDVVAWPAARAGIATFQDWIAGRQLFVPDWEALPAANLMYTSGTTGRPKGVVPPFAMERIGLLESLEVGLPERGPHLVAGPLYHGGPMRGSRHIWVGAPVIVMERFDAEEALRLIQIHSIASSTMVPTHFKRLLNLPDDVRGRYDISSLRRVIHTGAPCAADLKRAMIEWWGPILHDYYGGTETGTLCMIGSQDWLAHPGSVGQPVAGASVSVLDESGGPLAPGQVGALYFKYDSGFVPRYRGAAQSGTAAPRDDGSFTLGEIGYVDAENFVYITDRNSDLILSGGVNIYPAEAERVLLADPRIADAVCIGVPDADMGERLLALVERAAAHPELGEADVFAICRARLAKMKCPRQVAFVSATGRNDMGKVSRSRLRDLFLAGGEEAVARSAPPRRDAAIAQTTIRNPRRHPWPSPPST